MRATSVSAWRASKRHSSTSVALSEKRAKLTPRPSQLAPNGNGRPGRIFTGTSEGSEYETTAGPDQASIVPNASELSARPAGGEGARTSERPSARRERLV